MPVKVLSAWLEGKIINDFLRHFYGLQLIVCPWFITSNFLIYMYKYCSFKLHCKINLKYQTEINEFPDQKIDPDLWIWTSKIGVLYTLGQATLVCLVILT